MLAPSKGFLCPHELPVLLGLSTDVIAFLP